MAKFPRGIVGRNTNTLSIAELARGLEVGIGDQGAFAGAHRRTVVFIQLPDARNAARGSVCVVQTSSTDAATHDCFYISRCSTRQHICAITPTTACITLIFYLLSSYVVLSFLYVMVESKPTRKLHRLEAARRPLSSTSSPHSEQCVKCAELSGLAAQSSQRTRLDGSDQLDRVYARYDRGVAGTRDGERGCSVAGSESSLFPERNMNSGAGGFGDAGFADVNVPNVESVPEAAYRGGVAFGGDRAVGVLSFVRGVPAVHAAVDGAVSVNRSDGHVDKDDDESGDSILGCCSRATCWRPCHAQPTTVLCPRLTRVALVPQFSGSLRRLLVCRGGEAPAGEVEGVSGGECTLEEQRKDNHEVSNEMHILECLTSCGVTAFLHFTVIANTLELSAHSRFWRRR